MTTIASAVLVATTMPGKLAWVRVGGYFLYWIGCAVAFVPVVHLSDWVARSVNRRFEHVATDESLHEHLLRYRSELDRTMRRIRPDGDADADSHGDP